jgi:amino acid transporter
MDTTEASGPSSPGTREKKYLTVRQAAFIGVGAMVGAGIFALLGAAGEVAGAAVWLSFLIAGFVAVLQGYSFAKLGARYPSAGGLLEYVAKATGNGHFTGVTAWLTYSANAIVTAMVAVSFGSYAASTFAEGNQVWIKVFAALIILVMTGVNIVGSSLVANAQTVIVYIVLGILSVFAVVTLVNMTPSLLAAHLRIRSETGANLPMLVLAIVAAGAVFVTFVFTTLIHEPASIVTLLAIVAISIGLDYGWKRSRPSSPVPVQVVP